MSCFDVVDSNISHVTSFIQHEPTKLSMCQQGDQFVWEIIWYSSSRFIQARSTIQNTSHQWIHPPTPDIPDKSPVEAATIQYASRSSNSQLRATYILQLGHRRSTSTRDGTPHQLATQQRCSAMPSSKQSRLPCVAARQDVS